MQASVMYKAAKQMRWSEQCGAQMGLKMQILCHSPYK